MPCCNCAHEFKLLARAGVARLAGIHRIGAKVESGAHFFQRAGGKKFSSRTCHSAVILPWMPQQCDNFGMNARSSTGVQIHASFYKFVLPLWQTPDAVAESCAM